MNTRLHQNVTVMIQGQSRGFKPKQRWVQEAKAGSTYSKASCSYCLKELDQLFLDKYPETMIGFTSFAMLQPKESV